MNFSTNESIANSATGAGSSTFSSRFVPSSKRNPCPICDRTKDGDCRSAEAGNVVFCHSNRKPTDQVLNGYRYIREIDGGAGWGVWVWGEKKGKKYARPDAGETQKIYDYPARDGKHLIRVHRQKGREPEFYQSYFVDGQWLSAGKVSDEIKSQMRRAVPIYRYAEVRAAIDRGEPIVFVEGEKCYPGDTEVLTPDGWVRLDRYANQPVLEWRADGSSGFVQPSRFIQKEHSEGLIHTYTKGLSVMTTPDHDMVGIDHKGRVFKHRADAPPPANTILPRVARLDGEGVELSDEVIQLAIAVSADGNIQTRLKGNKWGEIQHHYVTIHLKKDRKKERIQQLLEACKIEYFVRECATQEGFTDFVCSFPLSFPVARVLPWNWIAEATSEQREMMLSEIQFWDGNTVPNRNQFEYSSKHLDNATWVQTLAHTSGRVSTICHRSSKLGEWYKVSVLHNKKHNRWGKTGVKQAALPFEGTVYCVTVPSGMILIRKDKTISVCGNCADALWAMGIAATTSIGGSKAFHRWGNYENDLEGASLLVAMPDRDQVGIAYIETVIKAIPAIKGWIKCFPKSPAWDVILPEDGGLDVADWIADGARKPDILALIEQVKKHGAAAGGADETPVDPAAVAASVEALIDQNLDDWIEVERLAKIGKLSGMDSKAFNALVGAIRSRREISETIERLNVEVNPTIDIGTILPPRFAAMMQHDAKLLGIDPIMLFHYLLCVLPAFLKKDTRLDIYGTLVPCIVWGVVVAKSGRGKTRAEKLICSFMTEQQTLTMQRYRENKQQYDKEVAAARKNQADDEEELQPPALPRKYVFSVATIQGVIKNLKEQIDRGSVWVRDEVAGLFKSLGQFMKGDHEGGEILLSLWDCTTVFWDRADAANSFEVINPHMSIIGGLQPGKFKQVFKDPDDVDGLAARILFVMPREIHQKHRAGYCELSSYLPEFFRAVEALDLGIVDIERAAYILWRDKEFEAREMGRVCGNGAMDAWLHKASGHLGRIALGLHVIECAVDPNKDRKVLTADTMRRAFIFWEYCRNCYDQILNTGASTNEIQVVLTKVLDKAIEMGGLSAREANQYIGAIATRAKEAGRTPSAYAYDLFSQLVEAGKGKVIQTGRTRKFIPLVCLSADEQIAAGVAPELIAPAPAEDDYEIPAEMPRRPAAVVEPEPECPFDDTEPPAPETPAPVETPPARDYFADDEIADFVSLAQTLIDANTPELIDSYLEVIPADIRADFKAVVMAGVILPTQEETPPPVVEEMIQEAIDLNAPPDSDLPPAWL